MDETNGLIRRLIKACAGKLHMDINEQSMESIVQFVKFALVGVTSTIVSYIINIFVVYSLRRFDVSWDFVAGNVVAFLLSVLWSFCLNSRFVFREKEGEHRNPWKILFRTYVSYALTGIVLNNVLSYFWIYIVGLSKYVGPLINVMINVPINFALNKLWAYNASSRKVNG